MGIYMNKLFSLNEVNTLMEDIPLFCIKESDILNSDSLFDNSINVVNAMIKSTNENYSTSMIKIQSSINKNKDILSNYSGAIQFGCNVRSKKFTMYYPKTTSYSPEGIYFKKDYIKAIENGESFKIDIKGLINKDLNSLNISSKSKLSNEMIIKKDEYPKFDSLSKSMISKDDVSELKLSYKNLMSAYKLALKEIKEVKNRMSVGKYDFSDKKIFNIVSTYLKSIIYLLNDQTKIFFTMVSATNASIKQSGKISISLKNIGISAHDAPRNENTIFNIEIL